MTNKQAKEIMLKLKKEITNDFDVLEDKEKEAFNKAIEALEQEPCDKCVYLESCEVSEYDKDHIWYKGHQYISLRRFLEVKTETKQEPCTDDVSRGVFEQVKWERDIAIEQLHELGYELGQKIEPCEDAINRQNIIDTYESCADMLSDEELEGANLVMKWVYKAPSVRPQALKILDTIDFAIDASNGDTDYFVGFRNGLRYTKSLVDGEEPQYENCSEEDIQAYIDATPSVRPQEKTGHWILTIEDWNKWTCSECGYYERTDIHVSLGWKFCPKCGVKMVEPQERSGEG